MKSILFSSGMVRSIMNQRKTQTRRMNGLALLNECPNEWTLCGQFPNDVYEFSCSGFSNFIYCPYGKIGDRIWVREAFGWNPDFVDGISVCYKADPEHTHDGIKWKPSIHMPRRVCRIELEITSIRIERLNDISEADAIAEGVEQMGTNMLDEPLWTRYDFRDGAEVAKSVGAHNATDSYRSLWEKINGKGSWKLNPWVWVVGFKSHIIQ